MAKTANLYARIEPDVKEQAEIILEDLTEEGLNRELMKGYSDITNGNKKAAEAVFDKIQKDYCI